MRTTDIETKVQGALYGLAIGDALAMPVHWYYNRQALAADYGWVSDFMAPRNPHPDSILWRSHYVAPHPKGEILHDQARFWGRPGIHYHQFLQAGENTLNVQICRLLIASLQDHGGYDAEDFLKRYIAFMTQPGNHRDTYIEECHRNFFHNYALGKPLDKCGATEKHIGGLVGIVPLILFYHGQPATARRKALAHLAWTHPGSKMAAAATLLTDVLLATLKDTPLKKVLTDAIEAQTSTLLGYPFIRWLQEPDDKIIGARFSPACYVEDAVPAVIYLALKYAHDPEQALIVNTNLGGDNAGRGAVLGALLGADGGVASFPQRWIENLLAPLPGFWDL